MQRSLQRKVSGYKDDRQNIYERCFGFNHVRQETFLDLRNNCSDVTIFANVVPHFSASDRDTQGHHNSCQGRVLILNSSTVPFGNTPGHKQPNKYSIRTNIIRHTFQGFMTSKKTNSKGHLSYSHS